MKSENSRSNKESKKSNKESSKEKDKSRENVSQSSKMKSKQNEKEATLNNISKLESEKVNDSTVIKDKDVEKPKESKDNEKLSEVKEEIQNNTVEKSEIKEENNEKLINNEDKPTNSKKSLRAIEKENKDQMQSGPKLSANAQKLKDLEDKMKLLEDSVFGIEENIKKNKDQKISFKEEMNTIVDKSADIQSQLNQKIIDKVKSAFSKEFDSASLKIVNLENNCNQLKEKNTSLEEENYELKRLLNLRDEEISKQKEKISSQQIDYNLLKENYDDILHDSEKKDYIIEQKEKNISSLKIELDEIKNVIGRLTEVRVILNKYFSSYFENFTNEEKALINDVKFQLNNKKVEPEEVGFTQYNRQDIKKRNENKRESDEIKLGTTSSINYDKYDNIQLNKSANNQAYYNEENNRVSMERRVPIDNNKFNQPPQFIGINQETNTLNASKRLSVNQSFKTGNPDDEFWYETKEKIN